ncbi:MAG: PAS domain S-box protein [Acidobacteria bacterium]|nr:PAS domain S-box protein [Acidobacteriota bacterium]
MRPPMGFNSDHRLKAEVEALRNTLERLACGTPLARFLEDLCLTLEELLEEGHCSVLLLDEESKRIRHGAGPNLPHGYIALIDGSPIGPKAGSCGTAIHRRRAVVVEDIAQDPLWEDYRAAALTFGLKACASVPILDPTGRPLGAFAIYHPEPGPFAPADLALLHRFTDIASLAIRITHRDELLRAEELRHRALVQQSGDGIYYFDADSGEILEANNAMHTLLGYPPGELAKRSIYDIIANDPASIQANIQATIAKGSHALGERQYRGKDGSIIPVEVAAAALKLGNRTVFSVITRDMRVRHQTQEALRLSEAKLKEAHRLGKLGHWSFDFASQQITWSDTIFEIFDRDPALGPPSFESYVAGLHSEDREAHVSRIQRAMAGTPNTGFDLRALTREGKVRWHRGQIHPVVSDGKVIGLYGVAQDITDQKEFEERLRQAAQDLDEAQALGRIGSWTLDLSSGVVRWSDTLYRLLGRPRELGPMSPEEGARFFDPDGTQGFQSLLDHLIRVGGEQESNVTTRLPDGTIRVFHSTIRALMAGETVVALKGVLQDITEQKEAQERQARSERSFRALFDLNPAAMVLSRPSDGTILRANEAAYRMFRLTPQEVEHRRTVDFFAHPEDRERLLGALSRQNHVEDFDLEMVVHGERRQVLLSAGMPDYLGERAILVALTDITDRAREQEALRQSQKLESLGLLAGGIAHDFNNLLTSLLGNLGLAQLHLPEGSSSSTYLSDMEAVIQRAADLARQMLAYSGKGRFRQEQVDVNHMVREMTHLLSVGIPKRVQLNLDLDPLPQRVQGDPVQLQQVVMNLVTNAAESIGDQNGSIRIRTERRRLDSAQRTRFAVGNQLPDGEYLCIEVQDSGSGMSPEVKARIFDPFFTTKTTGRGLGLSALMGILNGHKAGLSIETALGEGTTFCVWLSPLPADRVAQAPPPALATPATYRGRVLIVDDEASVRCSAGSLLQHLGFVVEEAQDGREALDRLQDLDGACDLILLDLTMPRMDGHETLGHIRQRWPRMPVILSSGYSEQADKLDLGGPGTFLPKPYRMSDLRAALSRALGT